tara:strand:+ start:4204 stop:6189 length:1986 start_codon:yes stop_codon:yes gene_type:complete
MPQANPDYGTNKKIIQKEVNYLGRDFNDIRQNLIEFAKSYFPNTFNDFNETDPGMMFIEMASYVGDVLNYYVDNQFRETLILQAEERKNIFDIAQSMGYKPSLSSPAHTKLTLTMEVPAVLNSDNETYSPNLSYAGIVSGDSIVTSNSGVQFTISDSVNFKVSSSLDPMLIEMVTPASGTDPETFKLTKYALCKSGTRESETFTFNSAKKFDKVILSNEDVTEIISITDSDGNKWYNVPYLAQDTVYEDEENVSLNDPDLAEFSNDTPYLLKLIKTPRRFTTYVRGVDNKTEVRFGSGVSGNADEEIVPNPDNVGSSLSTGLTKLDSTFDPSNFLNTRTFGLAPQNTTLTIKYNYGGSVEHNVRSNSITNGSDLTFTINSEGLDTTLVGDAEKSLTITNESSATGGSSEETIEEIRQNASAYFNAQGRAVTQRDYISRVYSLPQKYGNIAKCHLVQDEQLEQNTQTVIKNGKIKKQKNVSIIPNPLALNLYTLGYDDSGKLCSLNRAVKQNLKTYLSQYRMVTDGINLKDAYTININIRFSIITRRNFNKNDVLFRAIQNVKKHFDIKKWQINQPIVLSDIAYVLSLTDGVASVVPPTDNNESKQIVVIENKHSITDGYSGNIYDLQSAVKDGVIYPSLDPSIFELKYPDTDIEGRVVGDF